MKDKKFSTGQAIEQLEGLMARLRAEDGCSWDREQTHKTLLPHTLEEAYEVVEAVEVGNDSGLKEELGDLLFHIVFHSQIAQEEGRFSLSDVITGITEKMRARHPHLFGSEVGTLTEPAAVVRRWEEIKQLEKEQKRQEKGSAKHTPSIFDGINSRLSALLWSSKVQREMARVNFDWSNVKDIYAKIDEELDELKQAHRQGDPKAMEEEMGDLFFVLVNLCRHLEINPELALRWVTLKVQKRFRYIEARVAQMGQSVVETDLERLEALWQESKIRIG
ncbi:MAG: nucleoside triphosphate pyrophosphohydrolase [Magnetococcus sp. DMHC-6]